jgi:hypothetical protein
MDADKLIFSPMLSLAHAYQKKLHTATNHVANVTLSVVEHVSYNGTTTFT